MTLVFDDLEGDTRCGEPRPWGSSLWGVPSVAWRPNCGYKGRDGVVIAKEQEIFNCCVKGGGSHTFN